MESRLKLCKNKENEAVDPTTYMSIIGSLRYLVNTRPDLAYSASVVSRHMEAPGKAHWAAVKHKLRYLKGTSNYGCKYERGTELKPVLLGYSDNDFVGDVEDRKSTTGVVYFLSNSIVTWASQKQKIVAFVFV
jgi:heterodisulfide reductase subunit B